MLPIYLADISQITMDSVAKQGDPSLRSGQGLSTIEFKSDALLAF